VKRLTGAQLEARLVELDTPAHRIMASAVGGAGTVLGVGLVGIYEMKRHAFLRLRYPQTLWFALMTAVVGTAGGGVGHFLVVRVAKGPMEKRALICGGSVGFVTALCAWAVTFYGREVLSPFESSPQVDVVIRDAGKIAVLAGPVGGITASLLVVDVLKRVLHPSASSTANVGARTYTRRNRGGFSVARRDRWA
jgi:hypothetical protein